MRREEIFNLTWNDVDIEKRRIHIEKSKTGVPRLIVMPLYAMFKLAPLLTQLLKDTVKDEYNYKPTDRILYPLTKPTKKYSAVDNAMNNFRQALDDVRKKAGLYTEERADRFVFKCLRREADAQFLATPGLQPHHAARMLGHAEAGKKNMTMRYWSLDDNDLRYIQDQLDRHLLKGKTLAECYAELDAMSAEDKAKHDEYFWKTLKEIAERMDYYMPDHLGRSPRDKELQELPKRYAGKLKGDEQLNNDMRRMFRGGVGSRDNA
jgi:hypothetical protein